MVTIRDTSNTEDKIALHSIDLEVLGERIRRARLEKKISQRDLSNGLFTSAYLSSLELGKTRPTFITLLSLAERLDKSLDYFLRQASGLASEMDEEQVRILEVRLALLTAQTALAKGDTERAEKALEQIQLHLARLTNAERARYHYLRAAHLNLHKRMGEAITSLEEARVFLQDGYEQELEALIELELGTAHYLQRRLMPALSHYTNGYNLAMSLKESTIPNLKWKLLMNVANCYLLLNDWDQAINSFREALEETSSELDLRAQANVYFALAISYGERGDFQLACINMGRSLQIYEQIEDQGKLLRTHNALGEMYAQTGQYDSAEKQVQEALKMAQFVPMSDRCSEMSGLVTLASIRQKQGKLSDANKFIDQALALRSSCADAFYLGRLYRVAAEVQAEMGNKDVSEEYYQKAIKVIEPSGLANSLADIYHSYGQRLRNWGEVDKAFELMEKAYKQRERGRTERERDRN